MKYLRLRYVPEECSVLRDTGDFSEYDNSKSSEVNDTALEGSCIQEKQAHNSLTHCL